MEAVTVNSVTVHLTTLECFVKHVANNARMGALLTLMNVSVCVWRDLLETIARQVKSLNLAACTV